MNDEAEASRSSSRWHARGSSAGNADLDTFTDADREAIKRAQEQAAKERRLDAKRKRIALLDQLLKDLDALVLVELVTIYYLEHVCSFFWFAVRAIIHVALLTPLPDLQLARQHDEHKPFLPLILFTFGVNSMLHLICKAPSASEEPRGYLHGGLVIDFIGQQGPTSKWKLLLLDVCIFVMQLVMVSVTVKRRELKSNLKKATTIPIHTSPRPSISAEGASIPLANADREQDVDSEERGLLRRTDTLSDTGADQDDEDVLLSDSVIAGSMDALDTLISGQGVIGEFTLVDTLLEEHAKYQIYRQTRSESAASTSLSPDTLRQLHTIRMRFGVGG